MPRSDTVYDKVRRRIVAGDYPPGSHLREESISADLGVSRTPVRAALRRLDEDGLVKIEPRRGAHVAEFTRADIDEVFDLRRLLESRAARRAATTRSPEEATRLQTLADEMAQLADAEPLDRDTLLKNNHNFHDLVLSAARSPRQYRITSTLTQSSVTLGTFFSYTREDIVRSAQYHHDITWAIAAGEPELAGELMSSHVAIAHRTFIAQRFDKTTESAVTRNLDHNPNMRSVDPK